MPRSDQQVYPPRTPATPKPAATLILLRDAQDEHGHPHLEILMTRRSAQARFAPNAYVFPGGGLDEADAHGQHLTCQRPHQSTEQVTFARAAIRESFEELGILLAYDRHHQIAPPHTLDRTQALLPQCEALGYQLSVDQLYPFAHWTADRDLPKRFDTHFFVARMPPDQTPQADESEQFEPVWINPAQALEKHSRGQFFMIFPTIRTLTRLKDFSCAQDVLDACDGQHPLWHSCPRTGLMHGQETRYMEHESAYGELALVCPDGQVGHSLEWQHDHPVTLLKNVSRLTAPNPGFMTGPGTNSYLIGDPDTGYVVVDPGPHDAQHLEKLWRHAGGDIRYILCTHSHPDHSPGAKPLQKLCVEHTRPCPPILGLASGPSARSASEFTPDDTLVHGQTLVLRNAQGEPRHTLEILHTPGHAANHVCLILREDGLLFSGDHILNGSTPVIDPPDGNMTQYLDSLDLLLSHCEKYHVEYIFPAHGYVLHQARTTITRLKEHRLRREAKVMAALQSLPHGTMEEWIRLVYNDVPERLWPVAQRSLLAHMERLRELTLP